MFGPPDDVEGECNAHLHIADDYGDNHATMRCHLPNGHKGPHREIYDQCSGDEVIVTWNINERDRDLGEDESDDYILLREDFPHFTDEEFEEFARYSEEEAREDLHHFTDEEFEEFVRYSDEEEREGKERAEKIRKMTDEEKKEFFCFRRSSVA